MESKLSKKVEELLGFVVSYLAIYGGLDSILSKYWPESAVAEIAKIGMAAYLTLSIMHYKYKIEYLQNGIELLQDIISKYADKLEYVIEQCIKNKIKK